MKRNYILTASLLGGILLLAASCVKEKSNDDIYRPDGSEIIFSAATEYANGDGTRTEYSGANISGTNVSGTAATFERINWVDGDDVKIYYKVGSTASNGTYNIAGSSITANGKDSKADVFHTSGTKLTWNTGSGNDHVFTAVYPASATFDGTVMTGLIPDTQELKSVSASAQGDNVARYLPKDMSFAYMISRKTVAATSTTNRVDLPFTPAMTAFQFKFKVTEGMLPVTVTSFEMSVANDANPLTGQFTITINDENSFGATWNKTTSGTNPTTFGSPTGRKITVDFPGSGVEINSSSFLDFTIMALPVNISKATIKFTFSDNTTKTLKLQNGGNWVTFDACKKYVITNINVPGGESWKYYVEDIADIAAHGHVAIKNPGLPFTVKSYRKSNANVYEPVKWKVQYATSANGPWYDNPNMWGTGDDAKFSVTTLSGDGSLPSSTGEPNFANIERDHRYTSPDEYETNATLKLRGSLPSTTSDAGDGYFDLSKHPIYPVSAIDGAETTQETANCYVITRPGYYKFPLVYGNAINENATTATSGNNTMAYAPQGLSTTNTDNCRYFLRRFVRHDDRPITDPWIHNNGVNGNNFTVADAVVVWQDVAEASMQILLDSDISISNNYVKFRIREANIRPGNILIAARASDGTILWSWHLWVTEKELGPHTVVDGSGTTLQMMNFNLGWTDKVSGHGEHWVDWPFYVRIIQTDASGSILNSNNPQNEDNTGAADVFCVTQYGESISVKGNVGSNTFYQWGRKDPLLPAASNDTNKSIYSAAYSTSLIVESNTKVKTVRDDNGTIGQSIKIPYNIFYSRASEAIGTHNSNGSSGGTITRENHLFIGKATNDDGTSRGVAWFGNLWDTGLISYIGSSGAGNAVSLNNRQPIKSVYDPSPRGYVVPYIFAFTKFSNGAYNSTNYSTPNGTLASSGEGYDFNDGNSDTIFLPFAGARGGDGNNPLYDVNATMYYWTTGKLPYDDAYGSMHKSKRMAFFRYGHQTTSPEMYGQSDEYSEGAYSIRSVLQTAY